jgi:hypothetical protein
VADQLYWTVEFYWGRVTGFYEKVINVKADVAAVLVLAKLSTGVTAV